MRRSLSAFPFCLIGATREHLGNSEHRPCLHEGDGRGLTPIVAHQCQFLALDSHRELALQRLLPRQESVCALGL